MNHSSLCFFALAGIIFHLSFSYSAGDMCTDLAHLFRTSNVKMAAVINDRLLFLGKPMPHQIYDLPASSLSPNGSSVTLGANASALPLAQKWPTLYGSPLYNKTSNYFLIFALPRKGGQILFLNQLFTNAITTMVGGLLYPLSGGSSPIINQNFTGGAINDLNTGSIISSSVADTFHTIDNDEGYFYRCLLSGVTYTTKRWSFCLRNRSITMYRKHQDCQYENKWPYFQTGFTDGKRFYLFEAKHGVISFDSSALDTEKPVPVVTTSFDDFFVCSAGGEATTGGSAPAEEATPSAGIKAKSHKGVIIAVVIILVFLVGAGVFAWFFFGGKGGGESSLKPDSITPLGSGSAGKAPSGSSLAKPLASKSNAGSDLAKSKESSGKEGGGKESRKDDGESKESSMAMGATPKQASSKKGRAKGKTSSVQKGTKGKKKSSAKSAKKRTASKKKKSSAKSSRKNKTASKGRNRSSKLTKKDRKKSSKRSSKGKKSSANDRKKKRGSSAKSSRK